MTFPEIFNFTRSVSAGGNKAEDELSGFIPKEENESISTPPHDPFKPEERVQQDPKIVRETSPQSNIIFNFVKSLTSDIKQSSDNVEQAINDPSSVVDPAAGAMGKARQTSDKVKDDTPASDTVVTSPPKPKDEKPTGWSEKPKGETPEGWKAKAKNRWDKEEYY
ncbi:hypothetical protein [Chryseobacterium arthrosphaerae]|uniref:hypothetical protein n=1 Tax=Chryseobacterium arthrosphaerae TaxID=651561 RepID=UPI001E423048|nr:hypothetical protein [Chryseobacterium arthrosphaerae]UEQ75240.1 hypothetical protein J8N07_16455 [Chryseobacterium arthrosphaerae]WES96494.1 hypothetical protein P2W68_16800 [Chryseobacterium arthrosphaerae]